jgi:NAD(P)-dependent dehydrogenase (short-subunit alcohol dehydrogenase family)
MSQMSGLDRMFKEVPAELGMIDFLVNNAGIPDRRGLGLVRLGVTL